MYRLLICMVLCGSIFLVEGCAPSPQQQDSPRRSSAPAVGVIGAQWVAEEIERARIAHNWPELKKRLAVFPYTAAERNSAPSFPFVELDQKMGDLKSFEVPQLYIPTITSFPDQATGRRYQGVLIPIQETYTKGVVDTELAMVMEDGEWRLAGARTYHSNRKP